jgi:uncharacterized protein (DUF58 family)
MPPWAKSLLAQVDRNAWVRFFAALAGLTLAFGAAVYSTVFRDLGNIEATAILASVALLLAAIVGITTVPYLAKRVAVRRLRERLQYDFTGQGALFLLMTLAIGIAALNTGNNLLYIIVSAMLGAFLISGVASAGALRALELDVALPENVFAKQPVFGRITLRNRRLWAPVFSVSVGPLERASKTKRKWQRAVFSFPPWVPEEKRWLRMRDLVWKPAAAPGTLAPIFKDTIFFPLVPRGRSASLDVELTFPRRGKYQQASLGISTRFPFSFIIKTRQMNFSQELLVYPAIEETDEFFQVLPIITGEFEVFVRGRGNNLYLIREHMPEDSARHVDWKATAKTGSLKVREFTREDERKLRIVFDNPAPGIVSTVAYERAVSLAASLAWHFAGADTQLSFAAPAYSGSSVVYDFLQYLAVVMPDSAPSVLERLAVTDDYNIVITARPHGSLPTSLWSSSYFLFMK